jgi:hypothetical protein
MTSRASQGSHAGGQAIAPYAQWHLRPLETTLLQFNAWPLNSFTPAFWRK